MCHCAVIVFILLLPTLCLSNNFGSLKRTCISTQFVLLSPPPLLNLLCMDQFCYPRPFTAVKFVTRKSDRSRKSTSIPPPRAVCVWGGGLSHWTSIWRVDFWKICSPLVCETPCVPSVSSATRNCFRCGSRDCLKWWYSCCHRLVKPLFEAVWDAIKEHTYWLVFVTGRTCCLLWDHKTYVGLHCVQMRSPTV